MQSKHETEWCGFVRNIESGEYTAMFITSIGGLLAKERALEKAREYNSYEKTPKYDVNDVVVKEREVSITYGDWKPLSGRKRTA